MRIARPLLLDATAFRARCSVNTADSCCVGTSRSPTAVKGPNMPGGNAADDGPSTSGSSSGHIVQARDRAGYFQDRGIHIAPSPVQAADMPWPTSPPEYRRCERQCQISHAGTHPHSPQAFLLSECLAMHASTVALGGPVCYVPTAMVQSLLDIACRPVDRPKMRPPSLPNGGSANGPGSSQVGALASSFAHAWRCIHHALR